MRPKHDKIHEELYIGCMSFCMDEIVHFMYFPPLNGNDDGSDELYITIPRSNHCGIFKRLFYAAKLIFGSEKSIKEIMFGGVDIQNQDLEKIVNFLSYFSSLPLPDACPPSPLVVEEDARYMLHQFRIQPEYFDHGDNEYFFLGIYVTLIRDQSFWKRAVKAWKFFIHRHYDSFSFVLSKEQTLWIRESFQWALRQWEKEDESIS